MIFTLVCGGIAFISCGLVFFFPFKEQKANNTFVNSFKGTNLSFRLLSARGDNTMDHKASINEFLDSEKPMRKISEPEAEIKTLHEETVESDNIRSNKS